MNRPPSTRQSRFARCVRLLAWFALVLMIFPAYAVSVDASGNPGHVVQAGGKTFLAGQHANAQPIAHDQHDDDCCGKSNRGVCHCDAMCGSALLPSVPYVTGAFSQAGTRYAMLPTREAPVRDPIPPLRPPSV